MSSNESHRFGFETRMVHAGHIPDAVCARAVESTMAAPIPEPVDLDNVVRPAAECLAIAQQAVAIDVRTLSLQLKLINLEAANLADKAGLTVILNRRAKVERGRYAGRLHLVGMNTELISARNARLP